MGFFDLFRARSAQSPQPAQRPARSVEIRVSILSVHTAESLVIITTDSAGARAIVQASAENRGLDLASDETCVIFSPSTADDLPVRDPRHGWTIALSPALRQALADSALPTPGEYELTDRLAIIVENDSR